MPIVLEEFAGEWPRRWLRPLHSRDYATHLSNADLLELVALIPLRLINRWMNLWPT
ncbi:MAG TPA: hypothetical protein VHP11_08535 [Tepidisphaeraceae bacterium]|nr:hypothetical protein [Tepidisphaeraceae bacterium]